MDFQKLSHLTNRNPRQILYIRHLGLGLLIKIDNKYVHTKGIPYDFLSQLSGFYYFSSLKQNHIYHN